MIKIQFTGWRRGMRPIPFIHLLTDLGKLSLIESKRIKEEVVNNVPVEIFVADMKLANELVSKSREFGVECEVKF